MTIGGRSVRTARHIPVENPADGTVFAEAPACAPAELDAAVAAAWSVHPYWAGLAEDARRAALLDCAAAIEDHLHEIAELLTREQGKPLRSARAEVALAAAWFRHTAELTLRPQLLVDEAGTVATLNRVPHGVVAAITPYNFPIILAVTKIAPALLAGNTVVLKPSPVTPLSSLRMGEVLAEKLPEGVLNTVAGDAALGAVLTSHADIRLISFTGSVESGRAIAQAAAADFKRVVLELGGNDPCIVLPGTDLTQVAGELFQRSMENSGQFCAAIKRVYVARRQQAELLERLSALARAATVGDGLDPATDYGPLTTLSQLERVDGLVAAARRAGARVVTGGRLLDRAGYFYPPTVVTDLPPGTELEMAEQFGPVIPVMAYDDLADAVKRANATEFGLGGSVWGHDDTARKVAGELECGTVWINTHGDLRHDVPFGGVRSSGVGVEYGYWGLLEYTRVKVLNRATETAAKPSHMSSPVLHEPAPEQ
jgi:acyl-CoA reductase-like NAD-dependent aldehyde dehydrogenase